MLGKVLSHSGCQSHCLRAHALKHTAGDVKRRHPLAHKTHPPRSSYSAAPTCVLLSQSTRSSESWPSTKASAATPSAPMSLPEVCTQVPNSGHANKHTVRHEQINQRSHDRNKNILPKNSSCSSDSLSSPRASAVAPSAPISLPARAQAPPHAYGHVRRPATHPPAAASPRQMRWLQAAQLTNKRTCKIKHLQLRHMAQDTAERSRAPSINRVACADRTATTT